MRRWTQKIHGTACHILSSTKMSVVTPLSRSLLFVEPAELAVCWFFFILLKSGWNGIEMDIENGCKKLGRWKLVRTNRRCVGDAPVVVVCSWCQNAFLNTPLNIEGFVTKNQISNRSCLPLEIAKNTYLSTYCPAAIHFSSTAIL